MEIKWCQRKWLFLAILNVEWNVKCFVIDEPSLNESDIEVSRSRSRKKSYSHLVWPSDPSTDEYVWGYKVTFFYLETTVDTVRPKLTCDSQACIQDLLRYAPSIKESFFSICFSKGKIFLNLSQFCCFGFEMTHPADLA